MNNKNETPPIACDLTVFSAKTRQKFTVSQFDMFQSVEKVIELPDGYAFQFPNEPGIFMALANFVDHERQCCPFYHFALEAEPNNGPFRLRMTGGEGVKEFMEETWSDISAAVANQRIQTGPGSDLDEVIEKTTPILAEVIPKRQ